MSSEAPVSLRTVRVGLALVAFGVALLWVLFGWAALGLFVERENPQNFLADWPATVLRILWPAFLALQIVGQLLCITGAPRDWGARAREGPALGVNLLHLGVFLALFPQPWLGGLAAGLWALLLLAPALHLLFLTHLAPHMDQEPLGRRAGQLMFFLLVLLVLPVLLLASAIMFPTVVGNEATRWTLIIYLVQLVFGLVLMLAALVMYMNLHLAVYHAIPRYLESFAEKEQLKKAGWVDQPPW